MRDRAGNSLQLPRHRFPHRHTRGAGQLGRNGSPRWSVAGPGSRSATITHFAIPTHHETAGRFRFTVRRIQTLSQLLPPKPYHKVLGEADSRTLSRLGTNLRVTDRARLALRNELEPSGQLVRAVDGKWMTKPPSRCPNGHPLGPNQVLVGHVACLGAAAVDKQAGTAEPATPSCAARRSISLHCP